MCHGESPLSHLGTVTASIVKVCRDGERECQRYLRDEKERAVRKGGSAGHHGGTSAPPGVRVALRGASSALLRHVTATLRETVTRGEAMTGVCVSEHVWRLGCEGSYLAPVIRLML